MGEPRPWVKICGVTNREDALAVADSGADALGIVFVATSPRAITRREVEEILTALPATLLTVAVVANEDPGFIKDLARVCPFGGFQFHGEEPPEEVLAAKEYGRVIKAIQVRDARSLEQIPRYRGVDAVLLDSRDPRGGAKTCRPFDWKLALEAKAYGIPIIVAGGLNPENVEGVVAQLRPYGVDVSSGVEASAGRKDYQRVRDFVMRAKRR